MDFPFDITKALSADQNGFVIIDASSASTRAASVSTPSYNSYNRGPSFTSQDSTKSLLAQVVDKMGEASTRAQGLGQVITTYSKLLSSGDNRLYIKVEGNQVCGILKVGKKNLFYYDGFGGVKELRPLCVLDFYVHESMQRKGVGKVLFEKMLSKEAILPEKLAYDRPSSKFIAFLKKHYGLSSYVPQNNNFVIFNQYWENPQKVTKPKEQNIGSIQEYRDKKFNSNITVMQTDLQKTEKSGLETRNKFASIEQNTYRSQSSQLAPKVNQLPKVNQNYQFSSNDPYKKFEEKNKSRFDGVDKQRTPSYKEVESQMKAADEAFEKQKIKTDSLDLGKGKPQIWNVSSDKPKNNYATQAPWGSYGTMDSYKSSSAYGSYYQSTSNSRKK